MSDALKQSLARAEFILALSKGPFEDPDFLRFFKRYAAVYWMLNKGAR